jgi:hypothetical protein
MAIGSALITLNSLGYFHPEQLHPFVLEKLPQPLEQVWLVALYVHVVAAALALPSCLLMLSRRLLRRAPRVHRIVGRVTGVVVLVALVPSGAWLSFSADGGWPSTLGFLLSGAIVFVAMTLAIVRARQRDFAAHRRWVFHVVAQMSVAVTSRALLIAFALVELDPSRTYVLSLWLPIVISVWLAEQLARGGAARPTHRPGGFMKPLARLVTPLLVLGVLCTPALAGEPAPTAKDPTTAAVERRLLEPLRKHEAKRSRFSRARRPPAERRVRVLDKVAGVDANGDAFFSFAVDERYARGEDAWHADSIVGCYYPRDGAIYVKWSDGYRASKVLLGKRAKDAPDATCRASKATAQVAVR